MDPGDLQLLGFFVDRGSTNQVSRGHSFGVLLGLAALGRTKEL